MFIGFLRCDFRRQYGNMFPFRLHEYVNESHGTRRKLMGEIDEIFYLINFTDLIQTDYLSVSHSRIYHNNFGSLSKFQKVYGKLGMLRAPSLEWQLVSIWKKKKTEKKRIGWSTRCYGKSLDTSPSMTNMCKASGRESIDGKLERGFWMGVHQRQVGAWNIWARVD